MKKLLSLITLLFIGSIAFSQITITSTVTAPTCSGYGNGSATITPTGGNAPYTYTLASAPFTTNSTGIFSGLAIGNYALIVEDAAANTSSTTIIVTGPPQIIPTVTSIPALCFGTATGTINVISVSGGNSPFTYNLNGGAFTASSVFTNVPAGVYIAGMRDVNGCIGTQTVQVTEPTQISANITTTIVTCVGTCDGSAQAIPSGGTSPYSYNWQSFGNASQFTQTANNLCTGVYTISILDANSCMSFFPVLITPPSSITVAMTATNSNCGQANGAICASVTGGSGITSNLWSNGNTLLCNSNIPAGAYTFTVTDSNGCSAVANGLVNDIGAPNISISSQTNVSCFGGNNGAVSTTVTGGTSPYTYVWTIGGSQSSISGVPAGMYGVTVTDAVGCIGNQSVLITQPSTLNANIYANHVKCFGTPTGTVVAYGNGGTSPYTYLWPSLSSTVNAVQNLPAGNYSVIVTDANGCQATQSVNVLQPQQMTAVASLTNASCGGACDGAISMVVMGGNPGYIFNWTPAMAGNSSWQSNLCPGTYTFQAIDGNLCSVTNVITILGGVNNQIPNAALSSTSYSETCLQTGDGAVDLLITGSNTGPFTYQWNNGATTQDISNLYSGIYSVSVFDASMNCLTLSDTVYFDNTNCGTISGNVFIDNNSDCIKNAGDNNSNNTQIIANPGNRIGYTNSNGDYVFYNLPFATYTITSSTTANMLATCATTLNTTLNSGTPNSINNNFAKEYLPITQPDIYVSAWSQGIVPGFVCRVNYLVYNYNTFNANGIFKATLPSAFIPNITNAFPSAYTLSGDTIIWNFANISYTGWSPNFYVDFTTPLGTLLGSTFTSCMWAQPTVTDLNYANNNFCYQRPVTGSFDPNDKTVSPVGIGANGDISATETDLTYLIRFQNTGNGPAVNIYVKDTLSPNVDVNAFEMLSASHNYMIDILPGNVLRWKFNNIMLADSGSNEPASHGYIQYRIKRTNNNTPGTQIKNTAYIYFDFNEPVVTNTAINTIETITGIKSSSSNNDEWNVYPNPSTGVLYIVNSSSAKEASQIQVINSIGQTVLEETITSNYKNMDLSKLNNGVYFVKIVSDKQSVIKRVVLSK